MHVTNHIRPMRPILTLIALAMLTGFDAATAIESRVPIRSAQNAQVANTPEASPRGGPRRGRRAEGVYKDRIRPHWFADNTCFWYRNDLSGRTKEFILVNAERGTRQIAFDHRKLASALSEASGIDYPADRLPFDDIEFLNDMRVIRFTVDQETWACDLAPYTCTKSDKAVTPASSDESLDRTRFGQRRRGPGRNRGSSADSPDGRWTAFVKDHSVFVRAKDKGDEIQLSTDGTEGNAYGILSWAPDSRVLTAFRIQPGDNKQVHLIEWSPEGGGRATLQTRQYTLPGDKLATYELSLFDVEARKQTKADVDKLELDWQRPRLRWKRDQRHFTYEHVDRGHQRFRLIEVDSRTGRARNLIDERSKTFIWTAHTENLRLERVNWLDKTDEVIYASETDGWRHLYLVDAEQGRIANQITKGQWVVRGIDLIDEDARQVWLHASGRNPDQDPYLIHYYRVNFDGTGLVALTEGNGTHTIQYSPDRRFLIDTYSRVDMVPVHELRRTSDGKLMCPLEKADISELIAGGWTSPEVFTAKGRDGKTDIWGIICRPRDLDPHKKYPIIEQIYAGPQSAYVPKRFSPSRRFASLTDLGFIVVQMDGMGTAHRSKAFHDVCWKNLKDAGFPDRILWHRAAAKEYPYYDISRVGVYGNSAGGQSAAGAVLFHPELYKAAVASCGCHDNRMDKASWNEQWMGYPVGPQYAECSNIENAHRLRGKLFLIVGGMDTNVPPESTMRFVDALIRADKDFDLLVIPRGGHGMGGSYGSRRMYDFFVRHLLDVEPPNRNAAAED
ncbi:MAG: prolyl oligopeptidase family serine peptidase [Phycisphaerales bacterium]|nr:MAG: prolyl oligopeptidase family serine peptidase [Phycisphaerales bacterium]